MLVNKIKKVIMIGSFIASNFYCEYLHAEVQVELLKREEWGAHPPTRQMEPNTPTRLTIHHTGTNPNMKKALEAKLKSLQNFSQSESQLADGRIKAAWADVPYHFYIDIAGRAAEGRQAKYLGDSNTSYDLRGHLSIVLEGNFDTAAPSEVQVRALIALLKRLVVTYHIRPENIGAHKQFAKTACPGKFLMALLPQIRSEVSAHIDRGGAAGQ